MLEQLMARQARSHREIWCLHLGMWLAGATLLLATGYWDAIALGPLTFALVANAVIWSVRLKRRKIGASLEE